MNETALRMNHIYAWQTGLYDATRRYYLLGRDTLIERLAPRAGDRVIEIGCGTARNLIRARRRWPAARFMGIDISSVMLGEAARALRAARLAKDIRLAQADATSFNPDAIFGERSFDRVYFSYTLSMIPAWAEALEHATAMLAPGGVLLVADFGDQRGLPRWFRALLRAWLAFFHVTPRDDLESALRALAERHGLACEFTPAYRGYASLAALRRPS